MSALNLGPHQTFFYDIHFLANAENYSDLPLYLENKERTSVLEHIVELF